MAATLDQLFGLRNLSGLVRIFADEVGQQSVLTNIFKAGGQSSQLGEMVELDKLTFGRGLAPFSLVDVPSLRRDNLGKAILKAPWCEINVHKHIKMDKLRTKERGLGSLSPNAEAVLAAEMKDLLGGVMRSVEYVCAQVLFNKTGAAINSTTVPGSEVDFTLDFTTQDQNANAAWSTSTTKIMSSEMKLITRASLAAWGGRPKVAIHNADVTTYVIENNQVGDHYLGLPGGMQVLQSGNFDAFGGLGGIPEWLEYDIGYLPDGGSYTKFIENDYICFLPGRDMWSETLNFVEGYVSVPDSDGVIGAGQPLPPLRTGIVSYAQVLADPHAVKLIIVYRFCPVIRDKLKVTLFDCTP